MNWLLVGFAILMSILTLPSLRFLGDTLVMARRSIRAGKWPTTPGAITHLELRETPHSDGDGATHDVEVRYTYTVDGVSHEGSYLAIGYAEGGDREAHDEIHQKLKEARAVDVRYNPADPSESCLSFGMHRSIQTMLVVAVTITLVLMGFTLMIFVCSLRDTVLVNNLSVQ